MYTPNDSRNEIETPFILNKYIALTLPCIQLLICDVT